MPFYSQDPPYDISRCASHIDIDRTVHDTLGRLRQNIYDSIKASLHQYPPVLETESRDKARDEITYMMQVTFNIDGELRDFRVRFRTHIPYFYDDGDEGRHKRYVREEILTKLSNDILKAVMPRLGAAIVDKYPLPSI